MPTVQQLPPATVVNPTDEIMLDQSGTSVAATVAQVLAVGANAVTLTGDVTGTGTGTIATTLAPVATPGVFGKVTVNAKGQVTAGSALAGGDVTTALGFTPYNSTNPAGFVAAAALAPVATAGTYAALTGTPALGGMAAQNPAAVAITGGTIGGVDLSTDTVTAAGGATARTLAARAGDVINVLDYGADPTGVADCAAAFIAAMSAVPSGQAGTVFVPRGTYRLASFVNEPAGRLISMVFEDGANIGGGGLGVERIDTGLGAYTLRQGGGGWFGFAPAPGSQPNLAFHTDIVQNTSGNSGAMRVAWARTYGNYNYYGKYVGGIDIAEQNIFSWPFLYDNSSGWGHWEVINGPTWDEDSGARAHISASAEHSEFDVANNGPEAGWTYKSGVGNGVQGTSMDPWGQNGNYGGNILFAYGSVGSFDGQAGGINERWVGYPAVFSTGNPAAVAHDSTIVVTFDLTAKGTASLSAAGGVNAVAIGNGGGAYTSAPNVVFSGGGGSGAVGVPVMLGGAVVGVTITSAGSGYTAPPAVAFTGGGVATPAPVTITLNTDGAHGDVFSVAAAINAANIPNVRAAASIWGGVVTRLVVFGTAPFDLGTLTLGGTALGTLGINAGATSTPRDTMVVVFGGAGGVAIGDKLTVNGVVVTVGGAGALADVVAAIDGAGIPGVRADITAGGDLVLTAWLPQAFGGLTLAEPAGYTTLTKLNLTAGTFWPPTPPKGFATAYGELSTPICPTTDQIAISATDLNGGSYGPVTVTLNGGGGTGWPADVVASIQSAIGTAGWYNSGSLSMLSAAPGVLVAYTHGAGGNQGVVLRNTAGGTLTLANVTGTPLQLLGIAPGTYQPGGGSAGSQSVFMAAEDSIAPQGRGVFVGGASNATDRTVWPHAPMEARGGFLHGIRTDKASFDDSIALLLGASQAIAFGNGAGSVSLTNVGGVLEMNGAPVALSAAVPTHTSQLANDAGYLAAAAIPAGAGALLGATGTAGLATTIALGANLTLSGNTLSASGGGGSAGVASFNARTGAVALTSADVTGALGYTPGAGGGTVSSVVAGAGLAGGAITTTGTVSLGALAAGSLMGNAGAAAAVPGAIAVGSGLTLSAAGTLTATGGGGGVSSFNTRTGAVALTGADVTGALGFTPANAASASFANLTLGTGTVDIATTTTIDTGGNALIAGAVGGTTAGQIGWQLLVKSGYVQFGDSAATVPNAAGADAIDLQLDRSAATQIASGTRAVTLGARNTAGGVRAVAIGYNNTANGQGSVVLGQNASDGGAMGAVAFSGGYAGQAMTFQAAGLSGAGTAVRLTTDGNTPGAANVLNLPANTGLGGILTVTARNVATGDMALWTVTTLYKNSAGALSVSSPGTAAIGPAVADSTLTTATLTLTADATNAGLNLTVTPPAGVTVHASAVLRGAQIG